MGKLLASILSLVSLTGCASLDNAMCPGRSFYAYGYCWESNPNADYCPKEYTWIQMEPVQVMSICGDMKIGCHIVNTCSVVSNYSEEQAKKELVFNTPGEPK